MAAARERGVTLIELVAAITIIALAAGAILYAITSISSHGVDAMLRQQAIAVAEAYLEEILLQPVASPGGSAPASRASFNDIDEYGNLHDVGACDQYGNPIAALANYTVDVAVSQTTALTGITAANARRIDVTVTDPTGRTVMLTGYRANF